MTLHSEIESWDGKSIDVVERIYADFANDAQFSASLVELARHEATELGSTWLLKHHFENQCAPLKRQEANDWYQLASSLVHWESRLHLLQCMQYVPVPQNLIQQVRAFLESCITEQRKFVRAWAFSGYYELAKVHEQFQDEVQRLLERAVDSDEAASVRARIRQLQRAGF